MISHELASRIRPEDSLIMSCDPGTVNTKMLLQGWGACGIDVNNANDEYNLCTNAFDTEKHGKYFVSTSLATCSKDIYNNEKRLLLWNELERICDVKL